MVDGVVNIVGMFHASRERGRWWVLFIEGLVGIGAGLVTFLWPAITALALVFVIAAWALATGILEIVAAIRLRKYISGEWLLVLSGVISLILGALFVANPLVGALTIALWVGVYAIVFGGLLVGLGLRLRSWERDSHLGAGTSMPLPTS